MIYLIAFKIISLFMAIRFFRNIRVINHQTDYYFTQFRQLKRGLKWLYGIAFILFVGQYIPLNKIQNFISRPIKKEIIAENIYGHWQIEGGSNTIEYYEDRKFYFNVQSGRWGITDDILYLTYDGTNHTQEYIIHELGEDFYEMTSLDSDKVYQAYKID